MQINLTPDPSLLAIMVIFFLNYLIVRRFFLQPINGVIEAREAEVRTAERLYEESLARFNEATSQMESQLHTAKRDATQIRDRFRAEAGVHRAEVVEKTQGEAKVIVDARTKAERRCSAATQIESGLRALARSPRSASREAVDRHCSSSLYCTWRSSRVRRLPP